MVALCGSVDSVMVVEHLVYIKSCKRLKDNHPINVIEWLVQYNRIRDIMFMVQVLLNLINH